MWANPPEAEFQGTIAKLRKKNKISSLLVYALQSIKRKIRHFHFVVVQKQERNVPKSVMNVRNVVLLIDPIACLTFSLPSASLDLQVPNDAGSRMRENLVLLVILFF